MSRFIAGKTPEPPGPGQLRLLDDLPPPAERPGPRLAVTGLVSYARCPRRRAVPARALRPRRRGLLGWGPRGAADHGVVRARGRRRQPRLERLRRRRRPGTPGRAPRGGGRRSVRARPRLLLRPLRA